MKKTYKIKATKEVYIEVEVDDTVSQQEVYEIAEEKLKKSRPKWSKPVLCMARIDIDDSSDVSVKTQAMIRQNLNLT